MNRRDFLRGVLMASPALALDPERLLWVPGAKTIFLPSLTRSAWLSNVYLSNFYDEPRVVTITDATRTLWSGHLPANGMLYLLPNKGLQLSLADAPLITVIGNGGVHATYDLVRDGRVCTHVIDATDRVNTYTYTIPMEVTR